MSTYLAAEQAVLAHCRAYNSGATFTAANSSRNDFGVVTSANPYALTITMGGDTEEADNLTGPGYSGGRGSQGLYQERHQIKVTFYYAVGTGAAGLAAQVAALQGTVEGLKGYIRAHDRLGGAVSFVRPSRTTPVKELTVGGGGFTHLAQEILLIALCESEYPMSEGGW